MHHDLMSYLICLELCTIGVIEFIAWVMRAPELPWHD